MSFKLKVPKGPNEVIQRVESQHCHSVQCELPEEVTGELILHSGDSVVVAGNTEEKDITEEGGQRRDRQNKKVMSVWEWLQGAGEWCLRLIDAPPLASGGEEAAETREWVRGIVGPIALPEGSFGALTRSLRWVACLLLPPSPEAVGVVRWWAGEEWALPPGSGWWVGRLSHPEGRRVAAAVGATEFPCIALLSRNALGSLTLFARFQPPTLSTAPRAFATFAFPPHSLPPSHTGVPQEEVSIERRERDGRERREREELRRAQDQEYAAAEAADQMRERERQAREEREEREKEEREERDREEREREGDLETRVRERQRVLRSTVPPPPPLSESHVTVVLRDPSGVRWERSFAPSDAVEGSVRWLQTVVPASAASAWILRPYQLVLPFPRRVLPDLSLSFLDLHLGSHVTLFVETL